MRLASAFRLALGKSFSGIAENAHVTLVLVLALAWVLGGRSPLAQSPMQVAVGAPGFSPTMSYQDFGKGESINTFSGGLIVTHQSAVSLPQNNGETLRPARVYNSKGYESLGLISPFGPPYGWAGGSWEVSFGRVIVNLEDVRNYTASNNYSAMTLRNYYYQDESGEQHRLFPDFDHHFQTFVGPTPSNPYPDCLYPKTPDSGVASCMFFTNDGSYLRAVYYTQSNQWIILYPDGSKRVCGEAAKNAFIPPVGNYQTDPNDPTNANPWGGWWVKNAQVEGWYASTILDRAGNEIVLSYRPYDASSQPYRGSVQTITDQFGRVMHFEVYSSANAPGDNWKWGLLQMIWIPTAAGSTPNTAEIFEKYDYAQFSTSGNALVPEITTVTDGEGLQTIYGYTSGSSTMIGPLMTAIYYPTGATSSYGYGYIEYQAKVKCPPIEQCQDKWEPDTTVGVTSHTLTASPTGATGSNDNTLTWTWNRGSYNSQTGSVEAVVVDPTGRFVVHGFTAEDPNPPPHVPPGIERYTKTYSAPSAAAPSGALVAQTTLVNDYAKVGSPGDAASCILLTQYNGANPDDPSSQYVPFGDAHVIRSDESEFSPGASQPLWTKTTQNMLWDGYGHFLFQQGTGTNLPSGQSQVSASTYDLKLGDGASGGVPYQLDRVRYGYSGMATGVSVGASITVASNFTNPVTNASEGGLRAFVQTYDDDTVPGAGLLLSASQLRAKQASFTISSAGFESNPSAGASDPTTSITYDATAQKKGNILSVSYAGGQGGGNYGTTFTWDHAGVTSLKWNTITYDDFTRTIDPYTGRIVTHTPANGMSTSFTYDNLGRIKGITVPGEDPVTVIYPPASFSRGGVSWNGGNTINYYKGSGSFSNIGPKDTAAKYHFDDLGQPWKTETLSPDDTWATTLQGRDPFGQPVFSSSAYKSTDQVTETFKTYPVASGSSFSVLCAVKSDSPACNGQGVWTSIFDSATCTSPFNGSPDPFNRVRWVFNPDGSKTKTLYNANSQPLVTAVTQYGRNGQPGSESTTDTTNYTRDILGRLTAVNPQNGVGASAAYTYDGLGRLAAAVLASLTNTSTTQRRAFSYDALGHLTAAQNPENGTVTGMTYDALGNLLGYTDNKSQTFALTYDAKGRILSKGLQNVSPARINWLYDQEKANDGTVLGSSLGQLTYTETPWAKEIYIYSTNDGRLTTKRVTIGRSRADSNPRTYSVNYSYDNLGNIATEEAYFWNGESKGIRTDSSYAHGRLTQKIFDQSSDGIGILAKTSAYTPIEYFPSGAPSKIPYSNGTVTTLKEEAATGRLSNITAQYAGGTWTTGDYKYDGVGNITQIGSNTFTYDSLNRLTQATLYRDVNTASATVNYSPDAFGNLLSRSVASDTDHLLPPAARFSATYGTDNRIRTLNSSSTVVTYDSNGLLTADPTNRYAYDPLNQLLMATLKSNSTEEAYGYDASGERVYSEEGTHLDGVGGTPSLTQAVYFIRSGGQVIAEDQFVGAAHSNKGYLYFGAQMAATKKWDLSSSTQATSGATQNTYVICPKAYSESSGNTVLPTLGEPQLSLGHGTNYEADYTLSNVGPDVAGLVVRIARIKDRGASGSGGNGNGTPRNDEDQVQCSFYLRDGLDPDFVFNRFGLASNASYGTIGLLQRGAQILAAFPGLQTGKSYRFTFAIWTSVGANLNMGYDLVILEEGQLSVSKDYASSYLFVMNRYEPGQDNQVESQLHARWSTPDMPGAVAYNLLAPATDGTTMVLNAPAVQGDTWDQPSALVESLGVTDGSAVSLQALDQNTTTIGVIGLGGGDKIGTCGGKGGGGGPCMPDAVQAYNFSLPNTPKVYVTWPSCPSSNPAALYRIYRADKVGLVFNLIATTADSHFWDTSITRTSTYGYKIQAVGMDGVTLSNMSFAAWVDVSSTASGVKAPTKLRAVNTSTGDPANRSVQLTWQWSGDTTLPDGFSFIVYKASGVSAAVCSDVAAAQYLPCADGITGLTYTDTVFGADPDPLVSYEVAVAFVGVGPVSAFSDCAMTHVDACATLPQPPASVTGSADPSTGLVTLHWSPAADAGSWTTYEVYGAYWPIGGGYYWGNTTGSTYSFNTTSCFGTVSCDVVALDMRTGCRSVSVRVTVAVPPYTCPSVPAPQGVALAMNGNLATLSWQPVPASTAYTVTEYLIYWAPGLCSDPHTFQYLATVDSALTSYTDTVVAGTNNSYKVAAVTLVCGCVGPFSSCVDNNGVPPPPPPPGSGTVYFYVTDHLGTVRLVTDANGAIYSKHDYEPYGVELASTTGNASGNTHQFTGQERDFFTGNDYYHFRFYQQTMGRFMRPDNGVAQNPMNPQSLNLYTYVNGNPVNYNDPMGHIANGVGSYELGVQENVSLEDYLWGSAAVYETIGHVTVSSGGKTLDWGYYAPENPEGLSPTFLTGLGVEVWLEKTVGVPSDQLAGVIGQLKKAYATVGSGPELAVVIAANSENKFKVFYGKSTGKDGMTSSDDINRQVGIAKEQGYTGLKAVGHAHPFTGALIAGRGQQDFHQAEGPSTQDRDSCSGEYWIRHSWNNVPMFVLTTGHVYGYEQPLMYNVARQTPNSLLGSFASYSW